MIIFKARKCNHFNNSSQVNSAIEAHRRVTISGNYEMLRSDLKISSCFPEAFQVKLYPDSTPLQDDHMFIDEMLDMGICDFHVLFISGERRLTTYLWCPLINIKAHYVQNQASKEIVSFY